MQILVNENIIDYDTLFLCLEIIDNIEIIKDLEGKLELSETYDEDGIIGLSLNNFRELVSFIFNFQYNTSNVIVTVYRGKNIYEFLYNYKNKKTVIRSNAYCNGSIIFKRKIENNDYIYEIIDYKKRTEMTIKLSWNDINNDQLLIKYLSNLSDVSIVKIKDFIKSNNNLIKKLSIKYYNQINNDNDTYYYINNNRTKKLVR